MSENTKGWQPETGDTPNAREAACKILTLHRNLAVAHAAFWLCYA